jgi:hypothetical protein
MTTGPGEGIGRRPWWYSGDDQPSDEQPNPDEQPTAAGTDGAAPTAGVDWSILMAGAQRMVDWATDKVMAPHAEHDDPSEHPQCMVCRTIVLVGDSSGRGPGPAEPADPEAPAATTATDGAPEAIRWIPIRD